MALETICRPKPDWLQPVRQGNVVYDGIGHRKDIIHLNSWAHARREFSDALSNDRLRAEKALLFIQALYKAAREAIERNMGVAQHKELRLNETLPIINKFAKWMTAELPGN